MLNGTYLTDEKRSDKLLNPESKGTVTIEGEYRDFSDTNDDSLIQEN